MLSKDFLAQLSRHVSVARLGYSTDDADFAFGGVNVILCGDAHQIPPVAAAAGGALYHPRVKSKLHSVPAAADIGRTVYESFQTVVILKQQVRVTDPVWQRFLSNFHVGQVEENDVALLHSVTLTHPSCRPTDFTSDRWKDCVLITPRNGTQVQWNDMSVSEHCRRTGQQLLVVPALDTCADEKERRPISMYEKWVSLISGANSQKGRCGGKKMEQKSLPDEVCIAMGLKVMVTMNLNTEIDITNGARGIISGGRGTTFKRSVRRFQLPIAPAYAFTDYRAQGQTLPFAVIDIAEPPAGGKLNQANVYVALSRCSGLENVRILRDFDRTILQKPIDFDLMREDERLEDLNNSTKKWWDDMKARQ
ncbi:hypothetical protein FRC07_009216 [Ceratobasidium sp. 392]|nr:hypothetical protein FRC07_009216 [Ceratobasidium sp. 392]